MRSESECEAGIALDGTAEIASRSGREIDVLEGAFKGDGYRIVARAFWGGAGSTSSRQLLIGASSSASACPRRNVCR